ncbi:MAG: acyl-CoA dehydrogenase family protein [Candidatus Dormibacteria bacterium]
MDYTLEPGQIELHERASALTAELMALEDRCEAGNGLDDRSLAWAADRIRHHRLNAINMPAEWGGQGLSTFDQVIVQSVLGALTNALWDLVWRPANALRHCTDAQRERFLIPAIAGQRRDCFAVTEPDAGSDPTRIRTTATRVNGGYRLTGEKWFVTTGDVADFLIVLALVEPEGEPTLFLVDKNLAGVSVKRTPRYMHTFVFEHPEFLLEDVVVEADCVLGAVGRGYEITKEWFVEERLMIGARCIGGARRALNVASDFARTRVQFNRPIVEHQLIGAMLADSAVDIALMQALVHQVAWEADGRLERKLLHAKAAMVKLSASEMAGRVVDRCVQVLGGRGYMRDSPVERLYRDIRVDRIWEGTSEIQRIIIAGEIAKRGLTSLLDIAGAGTPPATG